MTDAKTQKLVRSSSRFVAAAAELDQSRIPEWATACNVTEAELREVIALTRVLSDPEHPQFDQAHTRIRVLAARLYPRVPEGPAK